MQEKESKNEPPPIKSKTWFDRSDLLSILAIVLSAIALCVSVYETGILKEQSTMMQVQQKASVWPYLEIVGSYQYNDRIDISFAFKNKGVGPAQIRKFQLTIDDKVFTDYDDLGAYFRKKLPGTNDLSISLSSLGGVLATDEQIQVFHLNMENYPDAIEIVRSLEFNYEICYCSIYNDCWYLNNELEQPVAGCQL